MTTSEDAPWAPAADRSSAAQRTTRGRRILCMGGSDRGRRDGFLVVVAAAPRIRKCPFRIVRLLLHVRGPRPQVANRAPISYRTSVRRREVMIVEFVVEFGGEPQDVTVTASGVADLATLRELVRA